MRYAAIRQYRVNPEKTEQLVGLVQEQLVPRIKALAGFVDYHLVCAQDGTLASIGIFEDQAAMDEADTLAEEWTKENLQTLLQFFPKGIGAAFSNVEGTLYGSVAEHSDTAQEDSETLEDASTQEVPQDSQSGALAGRLFTVEEVCEVLGMGKSWVYQRLRSGEIPSIRLGRVLKVKQEDLEEYLENQRWRQSNGLESSS